MSLTTFKSNVSRTVKQQSEAVDEPIAADRATVISTLPVAVESKTYFIPISDNWTILRRRAEFNETNDPVLVSVTPSALNAAAVRRLYFF